MNENMNVSQSVSHESGPFVQIGTILVRRALINGVMLPTVDVSSPDKNPGNLGFVLGFWVMGHGCMGAGFSTMEEAQKAYDQLKWNFEKEYRDWK